LGGDWPTLENVLSRLRADSDQLYPNRLASLEVAKQGFRKCGGAIQSASSAQPPLVRRTLSSYMVFFDFDRSSLSPQALNTIQQSAQSFLQGAFQRITVTGHDDAMPEENYSMAVSLRRANAVKDALVREGVPAGSISVIGRGQSQLLVPTAKGVREPQNRRVEIVLQ
jgi:outer membrane protein OmpA-like peptidoglycan-associated protein